MDGDGALAGGGYHGFERDRFERKAGPLLDAEPVEAGGGEVRGVGVAIGQLLQTCVDVAAELGPLGVREGEGALGASARAAGGDELRAGDFAAAHEHVPRVLALQADGDGEAGGHLGREVLGAVDREVGFASEQCLLEFGGEESLAALLLERPARLAVAGRGQDADLRGTAEGLLQAGGGVVRLLEGQRAAAGDDDDGAGHVERVRTGG